MEVHSETPAPLCLCESPSEDFHRGLVTGSGRFRGQHGVRGNRMVWCKSDFMAYMHVPKRSPRQEYRLKQQERIEGSLSIPTRFPQLRALKVMLEFLDAAGTTKQGEMKCTLNVEHAKSALWFGCPGVECAGGDFDLTDALAKAVAGRRKMATGELRCQGTRKRGDRESMTCGTLLRYKLKLNYD